MTNAELQKGAPGTRRGGLAWVALAYAAALAVAAALALALAGRHPILVAAVADLAATGVVFAFSAVLDNSSLYDPYWSVAPIPIALYWASGPGSALASRGRQILLLALLCAWGVRLTANWVVRWRGLSDEDFRYREIRRRTGKLYWPASFLSIHLLPTAWVFLALVPAFPALGGPGRPLGLLDCAAALVATSAILLEAVADLQLRRYLRHRTDPAGILESGLWAVFRHPNYLGEVLFWWGLFLFGLAADPGWAFAAVGAAAITCLFAFVSIPWMDRRMLAGHPAWKRHMETTPVLLPRPRRRGEVSPPRPS